MSLATISTQNELRAAFDELDALTRTPGKLTAEQQKRSSFLLAKISALKAGSLTTDDEVRARAAEAAREVGLDPALLTQRQRETRDLINYLRTGEAELRTYAGMDSLTSNAGGFLVPTGFQNELFKGISTLEPLFDENNVRFIRTPTGAKINVPGIDLSAMSAQIVGQGQDLAPNANPLASTNLFGTFTYRVTPVGVTFELEQDSFEPLAEILTEAYGVGFAMGIGADLISGTGITAPQGLLTAATDSLITTALATAITSDELTSIYFSLPRIHRANPKCAWVVSDAVYKLIRQAKDLNGRPLLSIERDLETLYGKKVLVSPSMNPKKIVLANLSQYVVRVATNSVRVKRVVDAPGYIERGLALMTSNMRVDAKLIQPASSVSPAIFATIHA